MRRQVVSVGIQKEAAAWFVTVVMLMLMCTHNTLCKSGLSVFIFIQLHVPCFIDTDCCSR